MRDGEQLGPRLRALRTMLGMTQVELAQRTGIDPVYISKIERGKKIPRIPTLHRFAAALGLSDDDRAELVFLSGRSSSSGVGGHSGEGPRGVLVGESHTSTPFAEPADPLMPRSHRTTLARLRGLARQQPLGADDAAWLSLWAVTLFRLGDHDGTRRTLGAATTALRGNVADYEALAGLAENVGDPALAAALYRRALSRAWEIAPRDPRRIELRRSFLAVFSRLPDAEVGIEDVAAEILAPFPEGTADFAIMLGVCADFLARAGRPAAVTYLARLALAYQVALRNRFDDPFALAGLADHLRRFWGATELATRLWRAVVELAPTNVDAWKPLLADLEASGAMVSEDVRSVLEAESGRGRLGVLQKCLGPAEDLASILEAAAAVVETVPRLPLATAVDPGCQGSEASSGRAASDRRGPWDEGPSR